MKRIALFLTLALLGAGCASGPGASTNTTVPSVEPKTEVKTGSMSESLANNIPRPKCETITSVANSMRAKTWVAGNDRELSVIFPALPPDTVLCGHFSTTKILIYATGLSPNEVMDYYERELGSRGFSTERKQQLFNGVGILGFTKTGGAAGSISTDGNKGFISITYIDDRVQ